tara:strand:- start:324 stop:617 length:294 start_codon:yes stop_codon:yes gene_type:complete
MIKNFFWSKEHAEMWMPMWYRLWDVGIKWQWQRGDFYYDPEYERVSLFINTYVSPDFDGIVPLPQPHTILRIKNILEEQNKNLGLARELESFILYVS